MNTYFLKDISDRVIILNNLPSNISEDKLKNDIENVIIPYAIPKKIKFILGIKKGAIEFYTKNDADLIRNTFFENNVFLNGTDIKLENYFR